MCLCCVQVGLVDEIGGLNRATDVAKQLAGLSLDPMATITHEWPPRWVGGGVGAYAYADELAGIKCTGRVHYCCSSVFSVCMYM